MVSDGQPTGLGPNQALTGGDMHHLSRSEHFRKYSTYQRAHLRFSEVSEHQDLGASYPPLALGSGLSRCEPVTDPADRVDELRFLWIGLEVPAEPHDEVVDGP